MYKVDERVGVTAIMTGWHRVQTAVGGRTVYFCDVVGHDNAVWPVTAHPGISDQSGMCSERESAKRAGGRRCGVAVIFYIFMPSPLLLFQIMSSSFYGSATPVDSGRIIRGPRIYLQLFCECSCNGTFFPSRSRSPVGLPLYELI
uniref:Uncharacterized protein n=1 Tax=Schistocephalus solidus TaxID=70667 RepID=A0A0X3NWD9_SCHSO